MRTQRMVSVMALTAVLLGGGCRKDEKPDQVIVSASVKARDSSAAASMRALARAEQAYRTTNSRYGTLPELVESGDLAVNPNNDRMSQFTCEPGENEFSCYSTPSGYPQTGRLSFFIDQTGKLRGADHQGARGGVADPIFEN